MKHIHSIQSSINYIEENLNSSITVKELAEKSFFSKFYYQRIFSSVVGESVMEHVRRRRLSLAAQELISSNKNIIDITYDYGFNSQDTFIRAFKRLYGITPGQYRKLKKLKIEKITSRKGKLNMYDWNFGKRINCCEEDKNECLELLNTIISLSKKAHQYGLLSLDSEINKYSSFLLNKGLQLLVIGTEPVLLREILENYIISGDYTGKGLLSRIIIMEGILAIQLGEYPWVIREKLSAYFGEDYSKNIEQYFRIDDKTESDRIQKYFHEIKDNKRPTETTTKLENTLKRFDNRTMQRILREMDIVDLVAAIKGTSKSIQERVFENLPKKTQILLIEIMESIKQIETCQIVDAQKKLLVTIKELRVNGDIK